MNPLAEGSISGEGAREACGNLTSLSGVSCVWVCRCCGKVRERTAMPLVLDFSSAASKMLYVVTWFLVGWLDVLSNMAARYGATFMHVTPKGHNLCFSA